MVNLLELEDSKITGQTTIPKREKVAAVVGLRDIKYKQKERKFVATFHRGFPYGLC